MLSINTNLSSLIAQNSMKLSTNSLNQAIERMTTGYKINHSKDNAANYSISTNMTTKIGSYNVAEDNCAMGLDMLVTAEETLSLIQDKLSRLRTLAVSAQNGTYGTQSLNSLEIEAKSIVSEIKRMYANTEYNGIKILENKSVDSLPATYSLSRATSFDTLERVSEAGTLVSGNSYRIDDSTDLVALQDYVNNGGDTTNVTFELTKDIDMTGVNFSGIGDEDSNTVFSGIFNGNNCIIRNLEINTFNKAATALFNITENSFISNVGLDNCLIKNSQGLFTSSLVAVAVNSCIENCYASGIVVGDMITSGLVGSISTNSIINNCYSSVSVSNNSTILPGDAIAAGLVGGSGEYSIVKNSFFIGNVESEDNLAWFVGSDVDGTLLLNNNYCCKSPAGYAISSDNGITVSPKSDILRESILNSMGFTEANGWTIKDGKPVLVSKTVSTPDSGGNAEDNSVGGIVLQVGIDASSNSNICFDITFDISDIDLILAGGLADTNCILLIDNMLEVFSKKMVEYGAVQNRLESVLEEIVISRDNLISSRSTLRDADIAEVSSEYIRQQILQQASATLLATANQSPSIALQLI